MHLDLFACRSTVVFIHWRFSWSVLRDHRYPLCSATGQRHTHWDSSNSATCDSHIFGWVWVGWIHQAPGALASDCGSCPHGYRRCAGVCIPWGTKAKQQLTIRTAMQAQSRRSLRCGIRTACNVAAWVIRRVCRWDRHLPSFGSHAHSEQV